LSRRRRAMSSSEEVFSCSIGEPVLLLFSGIEDFADFRPDFHRIERFVHVSGDVGRHGEHVLHLAFGGEDDDGDLPCLVVFGQLREDGVPVHDGHHDVQYDEVGLLALDLVQARFSVERGDHVVPVFLEKEPDQLHHVLFVVSH